MERLSRAYDDLRVAVQWAITRQETDLALRLVVRLPDFAYWRVGYELADWSEAALQLPTAGTHPLAPAVYGGAARGAWCLGDYPRAIRLARASGELEWVDGTSRCAKPGDVLAVIAGYEGRIEEAIAHYERQVDLARPAADPPRLNWALFHLAMCRAAVRDPLAGRLEAEEALSAAREAGRPIPPPCASGCWASVGLCNARTRRPRWRCSRRARRPLRPCATAGSTPSPGCTRPPPTACTPTPL